MYNENVVSVSLVLLRKCDVRRCAVAEQISRSYVSHITTQRCKGNRLPYIFAIIVR